LCLCLETKELYILSINIEIKSLHNDGAYQYHNYCIYTELDEVTIQLFTQSNEPTFGKLTKVGQILLYTINTF